MYTGVCGVHAGSPGSHIFLDVPSMAMTEEGPADAVNSEALHQLKPFIS